MSYSHGKTIQDDKRLLYKELMQEPLCLVNNSKAGHLTINGKTIKLLKGLNTPVVVVSIAGTYRLGKSYLMNLLAGKTKGFALGNTVQSQTKGIWIWCMPYPNDPNVTLILMDTEGLDDIEKGNEENDVHITILALLLSSTFIYNTVGTLDECVVNQLSFVSDLTNHIRIRADRRNEEISESCLPDNGFDNYFPNLVVVVRDFFLDLIEDGRPVSPNEYFNSCLQLKKLDRKCDQKQEQHVTKYNEPRRKMNKYFPPNKRHCCVLPSPTKDENELQKLDDLNIEKLKPEFLKEFVKVQKLIMDISRVKEFGVGEEVNGRMLADMTCCYVEALRDGKIPCIQSALQMTAIEENRRLLEESLQDYANEVRKLKLPMNLEELNVWHQEVSNRLITESKQKVVFKEYYTEFEKNLQLNLSDSFCDLKMRNEEASRTKCEELLQKLSKKIDAKMSRQEYLFPGGYAFYLNDLKRLKISYSLTPRLGVLSSAVLDEFLKHKENEMNFVRCADKKMTEIKKEEQIAAAEREATIKRRDEVNFRISCMETDEHLIQRLQREREEMLSEYRRLLTEQLRSFLVEKERRNQRLRNEYRLRRQELEERRQSPQSQVARNDEICVVQ